MGWLRRLRQRISRFAIAAIVNEVRLQDERQDALSDKINMVADELDKAVRYLRYDQRRIDDGLATLTSHVDGLRIVAARESNAASIYAFMDEKED